MVLFIEAYDEILFAQNRSSIEISIHIPSYAYFLSHPYIKILLPLSSFILSSYAKHHLDQHVILLQMV